VFLYRAREKEGDIAVGIVSLVKTAKLKTVFLGKGDGRMIFGLDFQRQSAQVLG
jgi:hypothetical protein